MIIAVASKRGPKVDAVRVVVGKIGPFLGSPTAAVDILTFDVDGGVDMPRSLGELLTGARRRVTKLQDVLHANHQPADYFVGMEGGFHTISDDGNILTFLQSWAFVSDGTTGHFGSSGNILVPERIVREVMERQRDLGIVIDEVALQSDVRSRQGTWGILTRDLLTRQQSFEIALTAAFAPFYNRQLY